LKTLLKTLTDIIKNTL